MEAVGYGATGTMDTYSGAQPDTMGGLTNIQKQVRLYLCNTICVIYITNIQKQVQLYLIILSVIYITNIQKQVQLYLIILSV